VQAKLLVCLDILLGAGKTFSLPGYTFFGGGGRAILLAFLDTLLGVPARLLVRLFWCAWIHFWADKTFGAPGYTFFFWGGGGRGQASLLLGAGKTFAVTGYTFRDRQDFWCAWIHF
jgi:hypothetical protein